jgi:hypothetical protein
MPTRTYLFERSWLAWSWLLPLLVAIPSRALDRRFTVSDDIRLTYIDAATFSPDNRYFVAVSQHGRIDLDRPESCLRVYRSEDVRRLLSGDQGKTPRPFWNFCRAVYGEGPNIQDVRWLRDSTGLVFLGKTASGSEQLFLAEVSTRKLEPLTPVTQDITGFDVRCREQFVYTVLSPAIRQSLMKQSRSTAIVGTGKSLTDLMTKRTNGPPDIWENDLSELWAVHHGKRFLVVDPSTGRPLRIHLEGERALALSPSGRHVVTALTVKVIPKQWESLYPSPFSSSPYRIRAGEQDPDALAGQRDVSQYVLIDIANGRVEPLLNAPIGNAAGWWGISHAAWSPDDHFVVLSNTFLPMTGLESTGRREPCIAAQDIRTRRVSCVAYRSDLQDGESGFPLISNVSFDSHDARIVNVQYGITDDRAEAASFVRKSDGLWVKTRRPALSNPSMFSVSIKQGPNEPPLLLAADPHTEKSRVLWNPNLWVSTLRLGRVCIYKWADKTGREWIGGLYVPPDHVPGRHYPLVIQTHGFDEQKFAASGSFPTAFAAEELASAGIMVLQVRDCPSEATQDEAPCQLGGYEAAIEKLSSDGLIDPSRVGIIGFSRTCFYVLSALTESNLRFKAASITDGVNEGYLQYMLDVDESDNAIAHEADAIIGAAPFGPGLLNWFERSPVFNMDRVTAPLQVVATRAGLLQMWEPYAALRYLRKPVDLLVLNSNEHVLSKPSQRLVSQSMTVDWYRYWLQDYRDPARAKAKQYERWDAMRRQMDLPGVPPPGGTN